MPSREPRWIGMRSACAMVRPSASNRTVEQSCRSLMLVEKAARIIALPISSTMVESALPTTSTVTGSTLRRGWSVACISVFDQDVEVGVDGRGLARQDQGGRVHLLDDRRAVQRVP